MGFFKQGKLKRLAKKAALMSKHRQANEVDNNTRLKETALYKQMAVIYDNSIFDKKHPEARNLALENLRAAASMGDHEAQYFVGQRLLDRGKFYVELKDSIYQCGAHQMYADNYFKEAVTFLRSSKEGGNLLAERLLGVAYINGWGVEADIDEGSKLLVSSIEREGSWDRASEIFAELGLNKPEFFSKFMIMKGKS